MTAGNIVAHIRVVGDIYRLKLEQCRLRMLLAIAQRVVRARHPAKVDGEVARSAYHAPVLIVRDQYLALADASPCQPERVVVVVEGDDLLLAKSADQREAARQNSDERPHGECLKLD